MKNVFLEDRGVFASDDNRDFLWEEWGSFLGDKRAFWAEKGSPPFLEDKRALGVDRGVVFLADGGSFWDAE